MKRRERKHLKEDEFVSSMTKIVRFFRHYKRELKIIGIALLVALAFLSVVRVIQINSSHRANRQLATILKLSHELREKAESSEGIPAELGQLEKLAGRGKYARLAYIYLATFWIEKNDLKKARTYLEKFPDEPRDLFFYQAKDLLGEILIWLGEYDQAIKLYEALEKEKNMPYIKESILFHLAEALEKNGDQAKALEKYRQLQQEFPYSAYIWNVGEKIRRLGG